MGKGDQHFERALTHVSERFPGQVAVRIGFDEGTARRIFAGSDFILMPSRYEPCGLSQVYAQRFGGTADWTRNGGLAETVLDGRTGFVFRRASIEPFLRAIGRALHTFGYKTQLNSMRQAAMQRVLAGKRRPKTT
jgi:starch synthase